MANATASSSTNHLGQANGGFRQRHGPVDEAILEVPEADATEEREKRKGSKRKGSRRDGAGSALSSRWGIGWEGHVKEGFRRLGDHCARNQVRTLLIDCLVMTNLFYPALAVYLQKRFPPLHPPSPPSHNSHRMPAQGHSGPSRRVQKEHPLSLLSTPILDSFFPYPPPLLPRLTWSGWWGRDTGQRDHGGWKVTRVPETEEEAGEGGDEVRIMRVGWADVGDVLDREVAAEHRAWAERDHILLRMVRDMAEGWERDHPATGASCIRELLPTPRPGHEAELTGLCQIISPHPGPESDHITPLTDLSTSSEPPANGSEALDSVPVGWAPKAGNVYHSVAALFRVPRSSGLAFEDSWEETLDDLAKEVQGEVYAEAQGPQGGAVDQTGKWLLAFTSTSAFDSPYSNNNNSMTDSLSPIQVPLQTPNFILVLYIFLFAILAAQISDAHKVHSRFGLAFTGITQLICSAVMSFSILVLLGWNGWGSSLQAPTLPTYILPLVIVVVGVENMSTLTKAVFSVPFTYSVPMRIGLGLSKVGTRIALTSLTDLGLLGLVWLCVNLRPVREFCLFAAVVILTDWFMLHTFFLTVLSIDAQRLELADVLGSDGISPTLAGAKKEAGTPTIMKDENTKVAGWRVILRTRTTKSGSLILMLITVGVLYYLSEIQRSATTISTAGLYGYRPTSTAMATSTVPIARASAFVTSATDLVRLPDPEKLWRVLNPFGWPFVRVVVPAASIIVLPRPGHHMLPGDIRKLSLPTSRLLLPRLKPLFYLFKVVILPQAVTASSLYMFLRYLLKDSDLLDAQRNRLGRDDSGHFSESENDISPKSLPENTRPQVLAGTSGPQVQMLPCSHESDVDIVAASPDGELLISVGVDNSICLWRFSEGRGMSGTRETLQATDMSADDPIVAVAISIDKRWACACSAAGVVQVWEVLPDVQPRAENARSLSGDRQYSRVTALSFDYAHSVSDDPFAETSLEDHSESEPPVLLVALSDGTILAIKGDADSSIKIPCTDDPARVFFLPATTGTHAGMRILIAGRKNVTLYDRTGHAWSGFDLPSDLMPNDRITCVCQKRDETIDLVALGHRSGLVEVFESNGRLVVSMGQHSSEGIHHIDLARPACFRCTGCGASSSEGFFVISSTSNHVYVDQIRPHSAVWCRCSTARRTVSMDGESSKDSSLSKPSTKGSLTVPPSSSRIRLTPRSSPTRLPTLLPPVSNGDFPLSSHGTRRLSNMHRDASERPPSPNPVKSSLSPPNGDTEHLDSGSDNEVHPLGAVFSPGGNGAWNVIQDTLIGIRRAGGGIDDSQWQVWAVDLTTPWNGTALLVETADLRSLLRRSNVQPVIGSGVSMRDRRSERLLSLNGRAPFPSISASISIPTHPSLGYIEIHPFTRRGPLSVVAGFGNRLGVISLPDKRLSRDVRQGSSGASIKATRPVVYAQTPPPRRGSVVADNSDSLGLAKKNS